MSARTSATATKSHRLAVRLSPAERALLDEASRSSDMTLSEFILGAATTAAADVLADRTRFTLHRADWDRFTNALDEAPRTLPRLRRLMRSQAPIRR